MKQKLKYFICILLLGIAANIAADEPAMEQKSLIGLPVISSETLVIALRKDLPPMSFLNVEGQPVGLFVDLWKLWSEKTGHKINFRITDWQDTVDSLKKGDADIHGAIYYSEDRSEWMAFSQPVYEFSLCFFFSKKHGEVLKINQLDGQKIGAIGGSYQEEKLRKHYPGIEIVPFTSIKDMIHSAREGEIRAFISTPATITVMLTQLGFTGEFESNDEKLFARKLHAGVLKDNQELLFLVDKGLDLISNRELAEIEQRWVPDPDKRYYRTHSYSTLEGGIGDVIRLTAEDFSRIDFQDYLESLVNHLHLSYQRSGNIHVSVAAKGVKMGLDNAVPCGLLITELVTNAFKYAFPAGLPCSGAGGCEIAVSAENDGTTYTLTVADNGVGLPAGLDWMKTKTLGLLLVKMLGEHQLQGRIEVDCINGTTFRLRFESK